MKKIALLLALLILASPAYSLSLGAAADLGAFSFIWEKGGTVNADLRAGVGDAFQFRIPVTYVWENSVGMLDFGLFLDYRPFGASGPFLSLSVVEAALFKETLKLVNEVHVGWTVSLPFNMFAEAALVVRDPTGAFETNFAEINSVLPEYGRFRFRVMFGVQFDGLFEGEEPSDAEENGSDARSDGKE